MRLLFGTVALLVCVNVLVGNVSAETIPTGDLDVLVSNSSIVFVGELTGIRLGDGVWSHQFQVVERVRGDFEEPIIVFQTRAGPGIRLPSCVGNEFLILAAKRRGRLVLTSAAYSVIPVSRDGDEWIVDPKEFAIRFGQIPAGGTAVHTLFGEPE